MFPTLALQFVLSVLPAGSADADYQKQANEAEWKFDDTTDVLKCLIAYEGKFQLAIHKSAFGNVVVAFTDDKGKIVYSYTGHARTPFVVIDEIVYLADYNRMSTGCTLAAFDLKNKKQLWETELKGLGPISHTKYRNDVNMTLSGDAIWLYGKESAGKYVEVVDRKSGKTVGSKVFKE